MAYAYRKKRFSRRPRKSRKANWMNKKYSVGDVAMAAYKGVKYIKGLVNVEFKKFDLNSSATPSSTGSMIHLSAIAQGDTDQNRNGSSLLPKSIYINFTMDLGGTAGSTILRSMLVLDKQQVADTAPAVADVLDSSPGNLLIAPLNNETVGRFKVLSDKLLQVDSVKNGSFRRFTHYKKLYSHIRFNGANATDIQKNGLYWLLVTNQPTNTPTIAYASRLTFVDN